MRTLLLGLAAGLLFACGAGEPPTSSPDAGALDTGSPDGGEPLDDRYLTHLASPSDLGALANGPGGVKYLVATEGRTRAAPLTADCYFQDMRRFAWHIQFLQSFPELAELSYDAYLAMMLLDATRVRWGGALEAHPGVSHPRTERLGVIAFVLYEQPGQLTADEIVEVFQTLTRCAPFTQDLLVFVPAGPDQKQLVTREQSYLRSQGVDTLAPERLLNGLAHQTYSAGEGYGTLRIVAQGTALENYGPRDVVVVESAPNDISLVQGLITSDPQNALSHVNLRLGEKGIPSVAVPRIYEADYLQSLSGLLVHIVANEARFTLEPARLADAEAFWASRVPELPPVRSDLTVTELAGLEALNHDSALAYGVKAANLGELHSVLPPENRVEGFAIPFAAYAAFMQSNGLNTEVEALLSDPNVRTDAAVKRQRLAELAKNIKNAPLDAAFEVALRARIEELFRDRAHQDRLRFRSSTNVEDLDVLTGAGLYDSKSGCLGDDLDEDELGPSVCLSAEERAVVEAQLAARREEFAAHPERAFLQELISDLEGDLSKEKTVSRALKRVWASLWNERAFDEREYYRIDHRAAFMGVAVHPTFVLEEAESVAVTHLVPTDGDPIYRLSSQIEGESVARPADPRAVAESLTFRRTGDPDRVADVNVLVHSSLSPEVDIWSPEQLDALGALLFMAHDHFSTNVYPHLSPLSLDVELKRDRQGHIVLKQARPYVSNGPSR